MFAKRLGAFFLDIIEVVVFAIAIFLFVYLLIMQPHKIKGASMEPNYPDGEYLLTEKVTYRFNEPSRGDVVVFEAPSTNGEEFIKRIVGLSGENIMTKDGKIYINSKLLNEPYLSPTVFTSSGRYLKEGVEFTIPPNKYAVLGDNRKSSSDSRSWGFVHKDEMNGRAWIVYWPPPKLGIVEKTEYSWAE
jgi:signal peptidase I